MYKILTPNKENKFEFTKEALEKLLDDVYNDGFKDGQLTSQPAKISYPINDPNSTGNPYNPLNPYVTWMGPNDVPPSCRDSSGSAYSTTTTTARKDGNL